MEKDGGSPGQHQDVPFPVLDELNSELHIDQVDKRQQSVLRLRRAQGVRPPTLPGNPFVSLTLEDIVRHLESTLLTKKLNTLAPYLWLVATQSSASISPLHKQRILGREVVVTDTADLHLIWYHSKIFIKPLPPYLLSHAFWHHVLCSNHQSPEQDRNIKKLHSSALGFVRTYCYLIRSETDFRLATAHNLIPEDIDFASFAHFITNFRNIPDAQVSPRFSFGELRLTRLNLWSTILLRQTHYFNMARQYETYFSRFFQPLLFTFGIFSVLLSAMQVGLAAGESEAIEQQGWAKFVSVSKWTAIATIIIVVVSVVWLLGVLVYKVLSELVYALVALIRKSLSLRRRSDIV